MSALDEEKILNGMQFPDNMRALILEELQKIKEEKNKDIVIPLVSNNATSAVIITPEILEKFPAIAQSVTASRPIKVNPDIAINERMEELRKLHNTTATAPKKSWLARIFRIK